MRYPKIPPHRKKKLKKLARMMNRQNIEGIPITSSLLRCFDIALSDEEVDFLLSMGTAPSNADKLRSLSGKSEGEYKSFLENILRKGFIWIRRDDAGNETFNLAPVMVGWIEIYLSDGKETPESIAFSRSLENYFQSFRRFNIFPLRNLFNLAHRFISKPLRTVATIDSEGKSGKKSSISVNRTLQPELSSVHPTRSVSELIEKYGDHHNIALMHCLCRQWHRMIDEPCRFDIPSESCMAIGMYTRQIVDYGIGRYITKEEALNILRESQKKGAMHIVFYDREDITLPEIGICSCCWDCCGIIGNYNRGIIPLHLRSHYLAHIPDDSLCTGCGRCEKFCPTAAAKVIEKKAQIDTGKCIGCGQCAFQCPENVIELRSEERDVLLPLQKKGEARIQG